MKNIQKLASLILCIALIIVSVPTVGIVAETADNKCGDNLTWSVENGILTISGTGEMYDYDEPTFSYYGEMDWNSQPPWYDEDFKDIVIEDGITSIGAYAFNDNLYEYASCSHIFTGGCLLDCPNYFTTSRGNIKSVIIPQSITSIGENAFNGCENITIKGYSGSYAEEYARNNGYDFEKIDGLCGDNLTWSVGDDVLTISGTGEMYDYNNVTVFEGIIVKTEDQYLGENYCPPAPWYFNICNDYTEADDRTAFDSIDVVIEDGTTYIGSYAFDGAVYTEYCDAGCPISNDPLLEEVFAPCHHACCSVNYGTITIPASVTSIADNAFYGCENITIKGYSGSYAETYANEKGYTFVSLGDSSVAVEPGDINGDELIDSNDVYMLENILMGKLAATESADVNQDGKVDVNDYVRLKKIIAGESGSSGDSSELEFEVETVTVQSGTDTVSLKIDINNNGGIAAARLILSYDTSALSLNTVENGDVFAELNVDNTEQNVIIWLENEPVEISGDGTACLLNFNVLTEAVGEYAVAVISSESADWDEQLIEATTVSGGVNIIEACSFGEWIIRTAATCTENGEKYRICSDCGKEETEIISALGHSYNEVVTEPTCTEGGYTTYTCHCGDSYIADETEALGHSFGEWTVRKAPTCTVSGLDYRTCSVCGLEETRETFATNHNYGEWIVRKEPTCTQSGLEYQVCSKCGGENARIIPIAGHSYEAVITVPTCTEGGYTTYTCHCGDSYVADETAALGHTYEAVVTAPTCTEGGFTTYTCHCGDSYVADETEALGHSYTEQIIAPTRDEQGYTLHSCNRCEHSYKDNFTSYSDFAEISVSSAVAGLGKTVKVKLSIKNNPGISVFVLGLDYDKTALTLESVELSGALGGMSTVNEKIVWFSNSDVYYEGEFATLTFTVSETAELGDYGITVTYADGDISNREEQDVAFAIKGGNISVIEHIAGDINNDGAVNSKDLTRFSKYLALEPDTVVNEAALDVNNDGFVNNKDLVCLMRYLSGDSVTVH